MNQVIIDLIHEIGVIIVGIAWPVITLTIIILLRSQIANALPQLLNSIKKLKYGKLEAEFDRVNREAEQVKLPELVPTEEGRVDAAVRVSDEYQRLAELSPRSTVMEAWIGFERTVMEYVGQYISDKRRPYISQFTLIELARSGIISEREKALIEDMRSLRNLAAHEPDFKVSPDRAMQYAVLLSRIEAKIKSSMLLSGDAKDLLLRAVQGDGAIIKAHTLREKCIQVNGENMISSQDTRTVAKWEAALEELEQNDFIKDRGHKGEVFGVTRKGYEYADTLTKDNTA